MSHEFQEDCAEKCTAAEDRELSQTQIALEELKEKHQILDKVIQRLRGRLKPVLNCLPKNEKEKNAGDLFGGCDIAQAIKREGSKVSSQITAIEEIIGELDI